MKNSPRFSSLNTKPNIAVERDAPQADELIRVSEQKPWPPYYLFTANRQCMERTSCRHSIGL